MTRPKRRSLPPAGKRARASSAPKHRRLRPGEAKHRDVPAVSRAIAVLRLLSTAGAPLGVNAIAAKLNAVPSTILRILRVLVREEFVTFDRDKKCYTLDAGVLTLTRKFHESGSFGHRVQEPLEVLSRKYRLTTLAIRVIGIDHIVVVASCSSNDMLRLHVQIGSRFPALMSATGRCVAAFQPYSWEEIEDRFNRIRRDVPPSPATWKREVEAARKKRYSVDNGNYLAGVKVIAAPVLDRHCRITHALVALGLSKQITELAEASLCREMKELAEQLSEP